MKKAITVFLILVIVIVGLLVSSSFQKDDFRIFLDKSAPYIGVNTPKNQGFFGDGIKIAVIDTGVDHNHPDLLGYGESGKVVGGKNFIEIGKPPIDLNGHGTQVAGIIAADGQQKGIAPKSKIYSYKVSDNGESVSSELIIQAIDQAIADNVDIINISLGVNRTNSKIDDAVNRAIDAGIVVIAAAGNDGPGLGTIGSPGHNPNAITVGATYNNVTSSLVATLEINGTQYQVIPMVGTKPISVPIIGNIMFGGYGRVSDLKNNDYSDSILLVERGNDNKDVLVYFSEKEFNAANSGAKAIIVYNNERGIFLGELIHEFSPDDYYPSIPALSISREDGLQIKEMLEKNTEGKIGVFYHPDFVTFFSSRGPVSPFYIKPDIVAPGVFVNTTTTNGKFNFTSGTSFAAPHVSGAVALLLEKNPDLNPHQIKSIITTTSDPVLDAYGAKFPSIIAGSGRLNLTKAFDANLVIEPPSITLSLSENKLDAKQFLHLSPIDGHIGDIDIKFNGLDFIEFSYKQIDNGLEISAKVKEKIFGTHDSRVFIDDGKTQYSVPIILHITRGSINVYEDNGKIKFDVTSPENWTFAKISAINSKTGEIFTTSTSPGKQSELHVYKKGEYGITAQISSKESSFEAYEKLVVTSEASQNSIKQFLEIPTSTLGIIFVIILIIVSVTLVYSRIQARV